MMGDLCVKKRLRDESEEPLSDVDSPEVKKLRENLLDSLDDDADFSTTNSDLDSFIKSFEREITASPLVAAAAAADAKSEVVDLSSNSGESRPDLGYLLEASDDDLGLPPTSSSPGVLETHELGVDSWKFEVENTGYDKYGFGLIQTDNFSCGNGEYAALDGLFDYSDLGFGSGDFTWRPEKLPAQ